MNQEMNQEVTKEYEFQVDGYDLRVEHKQPETFGQFCDGVWSFQLVMKADESVVLARTSLTIDDVCYQVQNYLLTCKYRPDAFITFVTVEHVRMTLKNKLSWDLSEKRYQQITTVQAKLASYVQKVQA